MFGLNKKISNWEKAGLLKADQVTAIKAYEKKHKSGVFGRGLVGVALFSIVVGVLSIVASNWYSIPGEVKIGVHVLVNIILALVVYTKSGIVREGATLMLFGLTLTLIALMGQVFQLGGSWAGALTLWLLATSLLMLTYGRTRITAWAWSLALTFSVFIVAFEWIEDFFNWRRHNDATAFLVFYSTGLIYALTITFIGFWDKFRTWREPFAETLSHVGVVLMLLGASFASLLWYGDVASDLKVDNYMGYVLLFLSAFLAQGMHYFAYDKYEGNDDYKHGALLIFGATVSMAVPFLIPLFDSSVFAALHFIIFWCFVGWIGQQADWSKLITLSITFITIRIFIIYAELFRDLLTTGFGLIFGGITVLVMIWGAKKANNYFTQKRTGEAK